MLYIDYDWNLDTSGILFDKDLDFTKLGWETGNYFKLVIDENGRYRLVKINELEEFLVKGSNNG